MQIVKARFHNLDELQQAHTSDVPNGGLFIPTTTALNAGSEVVVEMVCDGLPNKVLIRCTVRSWRPALPRLRVRAGAIVEFATEERDKYDFVVKALGGSIIPPRRKHTRIPVAVPVSFREHGTNDAHAGDLTEISIGGALLRSPLIPPPIGTELVLSLVPPGGAVPMEILGKVTYHTPTKGAGLKFTFRDGGGARRLRELIRRLRVA